MRRRRWSPEQKKAILAAAASGESTVTEVAQEYGITRSLIHNWRRQEAASLLGATVRFTPVTVEPVKQAPKAGLGGGRIEIELSGGVRVRLESPVDEEDLQRVIRALSR